MSSVDPPRGVVWYHGSPNDFDVLREGSTITRWRTLAEAFSHKPHSLGYETYGEGEVGHDGTEDGILYIVDEPIEIGTDVYQHPYTTMTDGAEFLTRRPLRMKKIALLPLGKEPTELK